MSRLARLGITLTIVSMLVVSLAGTGVAATAPPATATDTTESEVTAGTDATTSSNRITALFQQDWVDSCSTLETWLADIFTIFGLPVPDSPSDYTDHDQGAVDTDEPSETGSDGSVWDTDSDTETTDDSGTDDTVESSEETSDT